MHEYVFDEWTNNCWVIKAHYVACGCVDTTRRAHLIDMMQAVVLPNLSTLAPTMSAFASTMHQIDSLAPMLQHVGAEIMVTP
jgi:hypothetical protein